MRMCSRSGAHCRLSQRAEQSSAVVPRSVRSPVPASRLSTSNGASRVEICTRRATHAAGRRGSVRLRGGTEAGRRRLAHGAMGWQSRTGGPRPAARPEPASDDQTANEQADERDHRHDAPREPDRPVRPLRTEMVPPVAATSHAGRWRVARAARSARSRLAGCACAGPSASQVASCASSCCVIALAPRLRWARVVSLRALRASPGRRSGVASRRCRSAR